MTAGIINKCGRLSSRNLLIFALLVSCCHLAGATTGVDTIQSQLQTNLAGALTTLVSKATVWLGAFVTLQFIITNINLLKGDSDLQVVVAKLTGAVAWAGFCLYLINNGPALLRTVGNGFFSVIGVNLPDASVIMANSIAASAGLTAISLEVGALPLVGDTFGMIVWWIAVTWLVVGLWFSCKLFLLKIEITLVSIMSPLSFALLGMNALRDQGIAPFKSLVSLAYRVILLTVICEGFDTVASTAYTAFSNMTMTSILASGGGEIVKTLLDAVGAYALLAFLAFKSDSIASNLASGSTSLAPGDVAQAAATGAAAGFAASKVQSAGAALAKKAPQSMAGFMQKMSGGGSIANASSMGSGGDAPSMPSAAPVASMSSSASGSPPSVSAGTSGGSPQSTPKAASSGASGGVGLTSGRYGTSTPGEGESSGPAASGGTPSGGGQATESGASAGSGLSAGISGSGQQSNDTASDLKKLVEHLTKPKETTAREALGEAGRQLQQEKAATHGSISGHHAD
jgi:type IV secretion system protein TrbL